MITLPHSQKSLLTLLKEAANAWMEDNALRLSAALAYYSIFSIAPLLVVAIAIAGWIFGQDAARGLLDDQLRGLLGKQAAEGVGAMVASASKPSSSLLAGIVGTLTLLIGASGVFGELKDALNTIWGVKAKPGQGIMALVRQRLLSFGMVLVIGFLLLVSLLLTTAISGVTKFIGSAMPVLQFVVPISGFVVSFVVITLLFAAVFKILPDAEIQWRDVWIGAGATALLFEIGKWGMGWYLGRESTASAYGAAASAVLLLLWVYYASLILFFGAEFTQVYAQATGSAIQPSANAEPVATVSRLEQGLEPKSQPAVDPSMKPGWGEIAPPKEDLHLVFGLSPKERGEIEARLTPTEQFIADHPLPFLLAAVGTGITAVVVSERLSGRPILTPAEQVKEGSKALALSAAAATVGLLSRAWKRAEKTLEPEHLRETGEKVAKQASHIIRDTIHRFG